MIVEIYSGSRLTPVHTFNNVTRFDFILDGKWVKVTMKDDDGTHLKYTMLPVESFRQINCSYEDDDNHLQSENEDHEFESEVIYSRDNHSS